MTALLERLSLLVTCAVVLLVHLSLVSLAEFTAGKHNPFKMENEPYELECTLTGETKDRIDNSKIKWIRPGPKGTDKTVDKDDPVVNVTVKKDDGKLVSTLHVPRPPGFSSIQHYQCQLEPKISGEIDQHSFAIIGLKEKAVPKMQLTNKLEPARFKETVVLNCAVSYEKKSKFIEIQLIMSWEKNGKSLAVKTYDYKIGNFTETISYSFVITSHTDGGDYICSWELKTKQNESFPRNSSVNLQILPFLAGPAVKEVSDEAGSDVKLKCDVVGYPIRFEWRDEDNDVINGGDSRFRPEEEVLHIDDIDYKDRQGYKCLGIGENGTIVEQTIILRVKDPLAPLWPFIGIVVEAILVAAIILLSELYKKRRQNDADGAASKKETTDQPSTSQS